MTTLSVIIPAYNEEKGIAEIVQRVLAIQPSLTIAGVSELELIVVDDGSHDGTMMILQEICGRLGQVKQFTHPKNRGYGAALKTGFSLAGGELIGFLDADGTYPPEYFPQLCQAVLAGADLAIGSRMSGVDSKMPLTRWAGNLFFAGLLTLVGRQHVSDSASGMRVFKRDVLAKFYPLPDGLNLTPVMSTRALHEGVRMVEVPIPYSERVGRSKLSVLRDGTIFLQSILWTVMAYNPVRILGLIGLANIGLTFCVLLGLAFARLIGMTSIRPWGVVALYAALVSAVTGINLFALGATFNYLVSFFYKQPIRQGLFGRPLFTPPLEGYFGWMGVAGLIAGFGLSVVTLTLGLDGWEIERLWLYLLGSAMLMLVGVQLLVYWILMRVLAELNQREGLVERDLGVAAIALNPLKS